MSKKIEKAWWSDSLQLFTELSVWIAVPIIIAIYFGRYLDEKFHTDPWIFLGSLAFTFVLTNIVLVKKAFSAFKKIDSLGKTEPKDPKDNQSL